MTEETQFMPIHSGGKDRIKLLFFQSTSDFSMNISLIHEHLFDKYFFGLSLPKATKGKHVNK